MKYKKFLFVILASLLVLNYIEAIKVLILPFKNNSQNNQNIYDSIILDTIKSDITKIPRVLTRIDFDQILSKIKDEKGVNLFKEIYKENSGNFELKSNDVNKLLSSKEILINTGYRKIFYPVTLSDLSITESVYDYKSIYKNILGKSIDFVIQGYYYEENGIIRITFMVFDVAFDRVQIIFSNSGESGYQTFDVIIDSIKVFIDKINKEIYPLPDKLSTVLKDKQGRLISGEVKENFMILNLGFNYFGLFFTNQKNGNVTDFDLNSDKNKYYNGASPFMDLSIFNSYKKNYYGFGFKINIPFIYIAPNMQINWNFSVSYILGYLKEFYFYWSVGFLIKFYSKYRFIALEFDNVVFNYIGVLFGFNFRYQPEKFPFFIDTGFNFVLPKLLSDERRNPGFRIFVLNTEGYVSNQNLFIPAMPNLSAGVFFNKNTGIYLRTQFYFFYLQYYRDDLDSNGNIQKTYFGEEFAVNYDIELGIIIKSYFK